MRAVISTLLSFFLASVEFQYKIGKDNDKQ
jgi:hypothetical protein